MRSYIGRGCSLKRHPWAGIAVRVDSSEKSKRDRISIALALNDMPGRSSFPTVAPLRSGWYL